MSHLLNRRCAAVYCRRAGNNGKLRMFNFPKGNTDAQRQRYDIWADVAENPDLKIKRPRAYLCAHHFLPEQITGRGKCRLLRGTVPSRDAWNFSLASASTSPSIVHPVTSTSQAIEPIHSATSTSISESSTPTHLLPSTSTSQPSVSVPSTSSLQPSEPSHFLPSTSTPQLLQSVQLFPPILDANNSLESNFDTLATPLEGIVSLHENVLADDTADITSASTCKAKRKCESSVLSKINASRISHLTPRKKFLCGKLKSKESTLIKLRKMYKDKTLALKEFAAGFRSKTHYIVSRLSKSMSLSAAKLLASQVGHARRPPKGYRWSVSEKLLALSIYKRSPKCYTLLRTIFPLPCKSALINLLNSIPFSTGINSQIFEVLARSVSQLAKGYRICSLMFDEMAIREYLQYDPRSDRILGYEDLGSCRQSSNRIASHALVFMVRGLYRKWKQPVGVYFSKGGVNGKVLAELLKEVLHACREAGLVVVTTVCDMATNNVTALKEMGVSFEKPYFTFENQEVVTIYDPPHLLKCTRNMFYKHDVQLNVKYGEEEPCVMTASWSHVRDAVMHDRKSPYQGLFKVTDGHLDPDACRKMKVSVAAQVMSNIMAATVSNLSCRGILPNAAMATAQFISTVNKLFDSLNGSAADQKGPGGLHCRLQKIRESLHFNFWNDAIDEVDSWQFLKKSPANSSSNTVPQVLRPRSQSGWLATVNGVKHLWNSLKRKRFRYLETRSLNQDPLEHLFCCIRANCGSNNNPTVGQFQAALKTAIINGLAFRELKGANCEDEPGDVLSNLHEFLTAAPEPPSGQEPSPDTEEVPSDHSLLVDESSFSVAYVSGYIAERLLKDRTCNNCRASITTDVVENFDSNISLKEHFANKCLSYPTEELCKAVGAGVFLLEKMMPEVAYLPGVCKRVASAIEETVDFSWIGEKCVDHQVPIVSGIVRGICAISIPWWCRRMNHSLRGRRNGTKKLRTT